MKFNNNNNSNSNTVKMAADTTKQVRVDNWAVFFLQRLQLFFSKTDYCDMTLQFNGNVQLKVHKLVINACTDYFQLLEQTCLIDENTILMPSDLQADVIVPIINFMYTGMLEFQLSLYEKLYKTAQIMNITILTKLLEAQKLSVNTALKGGNNKRKQQIDIQQQTYLSSSSSSSTSTSSNHNTNTTTKTKAIQHIDLPTPLPGRKLPIWKRKSLPTTTTSSSSSTTSTTFTHHHQHENKWSLPPDPLSLSDNTPKPTRFEWPDDELPNLSLMDTSYESISLTSKPLLTQEEEVRGTNNNNNTTSTIFDDLKQLPNASHTTTLKTKQTLKTTLDMEEMKNYIKEQKIRIGLSNTTNNGDDDDDNIIDNDIDDYNSNDSNSIGGNNSNSNKRKIDEKTINKPMKRVRFNDNIIDNNNKTTISVTTDGKSNSKLDHNKIVTEILKKYPQLVKENKNIRLKIMSKNNRNEKEPNKVITTNINKPTRTTTTTRFNKIDIGESSSTSIPSSSSSSSMKVRKKKDQQSTTISNNDTEPWVCVHCSTPDETVEFVLYYLYRKHMTDYHNEKFDGRSCKYCGYTCSKNNMLYYHLYLKHGIRPPSHYNFPKCNLCPYIGLTQDILNRHRLRHNINEQQCSECKLAFTSHIALTSHIQITGHTGKTNKTNFDCQYCTKRYQSSVGLFIHVRMQHRNEAMRDGIVSIDEVDDYYTNDDDDDDDNDNDGDNNNNDGTDENEQNDEYILPEIVNTHQGKKVNILSNVKVTPTHQQQSQSNQQQLLEPSSEAEALNNVASGIATSLGLVDIVVLNDNQQIFLQSSSDQQTNFDHNQQQQQQEENEQQTEFILPELSTTTTNRDEQQQQHNQVITTDGVITQSMLTTDASTDELVMVLTDHDYGDGNQDEINNDNSNIVVLYSHPVESGQQEQYVTSQGNIMVNSRTGMIEIRNSAEVNSTSTNQQQQIDIDQQQQQPEQQQQQESHIESIEMIQREIESHTNDTTTTIDEDKSKSETQIDDNDEEFKKDNQNIDNEQNNETVDIKAEDRENNDNKLNQSTVVKECTNDDDDGDGSDNRESNDDKINNDEEIVLEEDKEKEKSSDNKEIIVEQQLPERNTDLTIDKEVEKQLDNSIEEITPIESIEVVEQDNEKKNEEENQKNISDDLDDKKETIDSQNDERIDDDKMDNDGIASDNKMNESEIKDQLHEDNSDSSIISQELRLNDGDNDDDDDDDGNDENNDTDKQQTTISDDSMKEQSNSSMKIAILDDWEDTDSQQSDNKDDRKTTIRVNTTTTTTTTATTTAVVATAAATEETVNKLMDDWADEDEDELKKD